MAHEITIGFYENNCRRSGNGGPQTCLPAAYGVAQRGPSTDHLHQHKLKTLARGQASQGGRQGASSGSASSGWLTRRRRVQGGVPREVPMTQAMTTKGARRVPARAVSSFPLWCKGGKRSRGVPRHQAKVAISCNEAKTRRTTRRRSPWSPRRRHHQSFVQAKTTFVRIAGTSCPLSN